MLPPGSTIGILGAGQLGRMLALAAAPLGLRTIVYDPERHGPAFDVATEHVTGRYDDEAALAAFAARCMAITTEFENVPAAALEFLAARRPTRPGPRVLAIAQDRLSEKTFARELGLTPPPFAPVASAADLVAALPTIGLPAVLKTRRLGYDGKGQVVIRRAEDAQGAWEAIGGTPAILEAFIAFEREVSIVAARGADGAFAAYDLVENVHRDHILATSTAPAKVADSLSVQATDQARHLAEALDYVGVFAIEFFVAHDGALLFNEIAPRVHNSGHWTIEGAATSQFEQHVRAVAGWPLGSTRRLFPRIVMENLIGEAVEHWREIAMEEGAHLHLYGKREARPGRKMGHVTRIFHS